jgi:histidine ammonia-lyase
MEDFVSMGVTSALKLRQSLDLAYRVIAIELLLAAQGLDFRAPLRPGRGVERALALVRSVAPTLVEDRPPSPDIEALAHAVRAGLLEALAPEAELAGTTAARMSHGRMGEPGALEADDAGRVRH